VLVWWVDCGWLLDAHPAVVAPLPSVGWEGGGVRWRSLWMEIKTVHLAITVTGKTGWIGEN